jgi:hypothetical protein
MDMVVLVYVVNQVYVKVAVMTMVFVTVMMIVLLSH